MKKYVYTKGKDRVTVETDGFGSIGNFMVTGIFGDKSKLVPLGSSLKTGDEVSVANMINIAKKCECDLVVYGSNDEIDTEVSQNFVPRIENLKVGIAFDEESYNSVVPKSYRDQYDYEASQDSLPWLVMTFDKVDENGKYQMELSINYGVSSLDTEASFAESCDAVGTRSEDNKVLTLKKETKNYVMFEVKKDLQISDGITTNKKFGVSVKYAGENYSAETTVE